jgi:hypothetical protein
VIGLLIILVCGIVAWAIVKHFGLGVPVPTEPSCVTWIGSVNTVPIADDAKHVNCFQPLLDQAVLRRGQMKIATQAIGTFSASRHHYGLTSAIDKEIRGFQGETWSLVVCAGGDDSGIKGGATAKIIEANAASNWLSALHRSGECANSNPWPFLHKEYTLSKQKILLASDNSILSGLRICNRCVRRTRGLSSEPICCLGLLDTAKGDRLGRFALRLGGIGLILGLNGEFMGIRAALSNLSQSGISSICAFGRRVSGFSHFSKLTVVDSSNQDVYRNTGYANSDQPFFARPNISLKFFGLALLMIGCGISGCGWYALVSRRRTGDCIADCWLGSRPTLLAES